MSGLINSAMPFKWATACGMKFDDGFSLFHSSLSSTVECFGLFASRIHRAVSDTCAASNSSSVVKLMVNPFRKSLVTGISKPNRSGLTTHIGVDPKDDRIPIGPGDVISMQRERAGIAQPQWVIQKQPMVDAFDVLIIRHAKRAVGQFSRIFKQRFAFLFSHTGIVRCVMGWGHSCFPVVDVVHVITVGEGNTNKNVRGAAV